MSVEERRTAVTGSDAGPTAKAGGGGDGAGKRPLLAVIVDNHVQGDSRVQKCAIAAAEAGYRGVLIGRANGTPGTYTIGSPSAPLEVRLVEAPFRLLALSRRAPRGRWRYPLAYPSIDHAAHRSLRLKAITADLQARKFLLRDRTVNPGRGTELLLFAQALRLIMDRYLHMARALSFRWMSARAKSEDSFGYRLGARVRSALAGPGAWRVPGPRAAGCRAHVRPGAGRTGTRPRARE
jgi:glycogen synthase